MSETPFFVTLKNRGLLRIAGKDREEFLQGLITNDINKLDTGTSVYACLLSPQGKFLFDMFIYKEHDSLVLDCEGGQRAQYLSNKLNMYKLRKDVSISVKLDIPVYSVFYEPEIGIPDPRQPEMGTRSFDKPDLEEKSFEEWDRRRIALTIPDGSRDLIPEKSTMDEANMDALNAIDYKKGCYVGQELTARMHYRGLGKRHLQTVKLNELPEGAELRSSCGDIGIALVKTTA